MQIAHRREGQSDAILTSGQALIVWVVLAIIARPYTWWRVTLVASMGVAFVFVLVVPALQGFFALKLVGVVMPWTAVGVAVVASAVLEFLWKWVERRFPD